MAVSVPAYAQNDGVAPIVNASIAVDSQENTIGGAGGAVDRVESDASTVRASWWHRNAMRPRHRIQIDLGAIHDVSGFTYLPPQDGNTSGRIARYAFYVSVDGVKWGAAVAVATFANTIAEQQVMFTPERGRYVRVRALGEVEDATWTVVAGLDVIGSIASGRLGSGSLMFTVSPDDAEVSEYVLKVYRAGDDPSVASPLSAFTLSRPKVVYGICTVDISAMVSSLPSGIYAATVSAIGAGGAGESAASEPFVRP